MKAGREIGLLLEGRQVPLLEIPMSVGHQPPEHREPQPGQQENHPEHQEGAVPLHLHQIREDVEDVAARPLDGVQDVDVAVLEDDPSLRSVCGGGASGMKEGEPFTSGVKG